MLTNTEFNEIWSTFNNDGKGFAVGDADDDINSITGAENYTLIKHAEHDNDVAVYQDGDAYLIVGDSNGPWAVQVYTVFCASCGKEIVSTAAKYINGEPYCTKCIEIGI